LAEFLRNRDAGDFLGPVLLGETFKPLKARHRVPALTLSWPNAAPRSGVTEARVTGFVSLAWADLENFEILVITNAVDLKEEALSKHLFEPVLFYLALRASATAPAFGTSARDWLATRAFYVYISCKDDLYTYTYTVTEEEARAYLSELVADFLDPTAYDLLPFEVIAKDSSKQHPLSAAYLLPDHQVEALRANYHLRLKDRIEEARESDFGNYWRSPLLDLAGVQVPEDALAKIRRRFRALDRGPRLYREEKAK
jgi:hypothetical protein